jgi:putative transposase
MPRTARIAPGDVIYHVLNRGVGKTTLFRKPGDFEAFQRCVIRTREASPIRVLAYCVMSNHWHFVLWPARDGELAKFMLRLTVSHARRWLIHRELVGTGHLYQGRYKSFPMQDDAHLSTVCRYVERNPVRAALVTHSANWPWSSAGQERLPADLRVSLTDFAKRRDWAAWVDRPQTADEEAAIAKSILENRPFGDEQWVDSMKRTLGWREPLKPGRPRKQHS